MRSERRRQRATPAVKHLYTRPDGMAPLHAQCYCGPQLGAESTAVFQGAEGAHASCWPIPQPSVLKRSRHLGMPPQLQSMLCKAL